MKKIILFLILIVFYPKIIISQDIKLTGIVTDNTGESVIGALIIDSTGNFRALTDEFGYFNIKMPIGNYVFHLRATGYKELEFKLYLNKDTSLNIILYEDVHNIDEISVVAEKKIMSSDNLSQISVPISLIAKQPVIFGEKDVFKTIQTLPGIQPAVEGSSKLNIRGSSADQNLVLIDDMPIYFVYHIYGFLSTFNNDIIKNIKIYKGAIPAQYSGSASSVVDIKTKDGNLYNHKKKLDIGIFAATLMLEGPAKKTKASYVFSCRRSFWDFLIRPISKSYGGDGNFTANYNLFDINAKVRFVINSKNKLYWSIYTGGDKVFTILKSQYEHKLYGTVDEYKRWETNFRNIASSVRFFSVLHDNITFNSILVFSDFNFVNLDRYDAKHNYGNANLVNLLAEKQNNINNIIFKTHFDFYWKNFIHLKIGSDIKNTKFNINIISEYYDFERSELNMNDVKTYNSDSYTTSFYSQLNLKSKFIKSVLGVNWNNYFIAGEKFSYIEPRLMFNLKLTRFLSLQASYSALHQFEHLLTNSAISMPANIFVPATENALPISTHIYDVATSINIGKNINLDLSAYLKKGSNFIRYKQGINQFFFSDSWENEIASGTAENYGAEVLLYGSFKRLYFWLSYTYSRSWRKFDLINRGEKFPFKYDRPHILNCVFTYNLSDVFDISLDWVFMSGYNTTIHTNVYGGGFWSDLQYSVIQVNYYENINNLRLPDFHRLDISVNYHKPASKSSWTFGVYNVYNRKNPMFLYGTYNGKYTGITLFPILPFIRYSYKF